MDEEKKTEQQLRLEAQDAEMKSQFARSHHWRLIKATLVKRVMELDSASAVIELERKKRKGVDEISRILYTNGKAVEIIVDWINEIETLGGNSAPDFMGEVNAEKEEGIIVELPN